jgi:threonine/homoserine efflux transporter RhtA
MQLVAVGLTALGLGLVVGLPGAGDRDVLGLGFGVLTGALYGAYLLYSERRLPSRGPPRAAHAAGGTAVGSGSHPAGQLVSENRK